MAIESFGAARGVLRAIVLIGYGVVGLAVVAAMVASRDAGPLGALSVFFVGFVAGIVIVAQAQIGLAVVSTAETNAAILSELRAGAARGGAERDGPRASIDAAQSVRATTPERLSEPGLVKHYKGRAILRTKTGIEVDGQAFSGVLAAERYIDGL